MPRRPTEPLPWQKGGTAHPDGAVYTAPYLWHCRLCGDEMRKPPMHLICQSCGVPVQVGALPAELRLYFQRFGLADEAGDELDARAEPNVRYGRATRPRSQP